MHGRGFLTKWLPTYPNADVEPSLRQGFQRPFPARFAFGEDWHAVSRFVSSLKGCLCGRRRRDTPGIWPFVSNLGRPRKRAHAKCPAPAPAASKAGGQICELSFETLGVSVHTSAKT